MVAVARGMAFLLLIADKMGADGVAGSPAVRSWPARSVAGVYVPGAEDARRAGRAGMDRGTDAATAACIQTD